MTGPTDSTGSAFVETDDWDPSLRKTVRNEVCPRTEAHTAVQGRILLASSNFPRWAGDSTTPFILNLAQDLQSLGWQVDVLAPHAPGAARRERLAGVSVERFRYWWPERYESVCYQGGALINLRKNRANYAKLPTLVLAEWWAITRLLASGHYDLLNSHWILPQGLTGVLAAKSIGVPHVITVHGGDVFGLRGRTLTRLKGFALRHATAVTVNSTATERSVGEIAPDLTSLHRIPMGASVPRPDALAAAPEIRARYRQGTGPLLIFVGRLVEEKGLGDLIEAVAELRHRLPDTVLMVVGDGQDRAIFEALAARLDLGGRVHFLGWIEAGMLPSYLAAADVFIGPSKRSPDGWVEAQGLTFAEAMSTGVPVIATRSGGIPDTVRHEETGLLVDEASPTQLAAAVLRLHRAPDLARHLADAGRFLACNEFSHDKMAARFSALFESLINVPKL